MLSSVSIMRLVNLSSKAQEKKRLRRAPAEHRRKPIPTLAEADV